MTRGKMILVDKQDNDILLHKTCEFNGDMYISWYGKRIIAELEHIYKYEEFEKYVKYFNDNNFDYGADYFGIYTKVVEDKTINVCDNYFDNWFSDYLYFKNVSGEDITMICNINDKVEKITMANEEIKVFYYGTLVDYKKEIRECYNTSKDKDIDLLNDLGSARVDKLYRISCIKASDNSLDDEEVLRLADILEEIYLKDENKRSLGELSDLLVNVKDDIKEYDTIRDILIKCDMFDDSDIDY